MMVPKMNTPAVRAGLPKRDLVVGGPINPEDNGGRTLTQAEAWQLACVVFGSELPAPRRDICGSTSDGIRYWRAAR